MELEMNELAHTWDADLTDTQRLMIINDIFLCSDNKSEFGENLKLLIDYKKNN